MKQESFDPGLTTQFSGELRRTINVDGSFNVKRTGLRWRDANPYLMLIDTTWPRFLGIVLAGFLTINVIFACLYLAIGIGKLKGLESDMTAFENAFFFSVHTLTTVGYGNVYPEGPWANVISSLEAATGLMVFAVATGLLYGRFSRPSARIVYSRNAIIAPYQDGTSLQFRVANARSNTLMNMEARVLLMTVDTTDGELRRNFIDLALERPKIYFFALTWTIVHPIDETSPFFGKSREDLARLESEVLILLQGFDDTFSQVVHSRYSYRHDELIWGAKFTPAFKVDNKGGLVVEVDRIHELRMIG
ncbi:MAG TPA: ion channel [Bryobacteraceae bacterium]|nr:ion channel [Bryobacteraceae bacterium]